MFQSLYIAIQYLKLRYNAIQAYSPHDFILWDSTSLQRLLQYKTVKTVRPVAEGCELL